MNAPPYPAPSSPAVTRSMQANRHRDTGPERAVRTLLHAAGLRYRVDLAIPLPGRRARPDIVFTRQRLAVFIDGCFWHGCPKHGSEPKTNRDYWLPKLAENKERDREHNRLLRAAGWEVVRIWEHTPPAEAAAEIIAMLARREGVG